MASRWKEIIKTLNKKENLEVIALTNEEFERLCNFDLSGNKKLAQVRDVFCFSCSTGSVTLISNSLGKNTSKKMKQGLQ